MKIVLFQLAIAILCVEIYAQPGTNHLSLKSNGFVPAEIGFAKEMKSDTVWFDPKKRVACNSYLIREEFVKTKKVKDEANPKKLKLFRHYKLKSINDTLSVHYTEFYPEHKSYARNKEELQLLLLASQYKLLYEKKLKLLSDSLDTLNLKLGDPAINRGDLLLLDQRKKEILDDAERIEEFRNRSIFLFCDYRSKAGIICGKVPGKIFPTITRHDASIRTKYIFENDLEGLRFLSEANFSIPTNKSNKVNTYLGFYKDYMGYFKTSIGTMVQQTGKVKKDTNGLVVVDSTERKIDAISRIIGGGGNISANLTLPFYYFKSKNELTRIFLAFQNSSVLDIPGLGTTNGDINFADFIGFEASTYFSGLDGDIAFFASMKLSQAFGTQKYFDYLGIGNDSYIRKDGMYMNSFMFGVSLGSMFRISYTVFGGDKFVRENFGKSIQVSFVPNSNILKRK